MIFCVKCGKEIQEDFKICPYCGKEIALPTSADQPAPTAEQTEQTAVETAVQTAPAQTATEPTAQTAVETPAPAAPTAPTTPAPTAQTATAPMPTASAPAQTAPTAPVYTAGQVPQFAPQYTAGVPQGYYQQNIPAGYAYPAQTAPPAPVAVKKKTHPATVILLIFGLLCIAGAAVYTYFNRDMFVSKANAEEVLPCSFDVHAWRVDSEPTSKYTISSEDKQQVLDELNKYIQSEFPTKEVNLNSSVFVVPPIKLTLDADAGTEYSGAERSDLRGGYFTVILNKSLYDLETNIDYQYDIGDNMPRFYIFSRDAEGDVEFDSVFAYYEYFDDNFESPVFAIIDADTLLSQIGVKPEEIAQMDE